MKIEPIRRARVRIGLLETEPIRAAGFRSIFEDQAEVELVTTDLNGLIADRTLAMALVGLHQPGHAFDTLTAIKMARPQVRIIVMGSETDDETIISAIAAGAKGYLEETASPEQVEQAIRVVGDGSIWAPRRVLSIFVDRALQAASGKALRRAPGQFTDRELEVLRLLVGAHSNREIASILGIEERTVKAHVARLMRKVGVENRIALSVHAVTHAIILQERKGGSSQPPSTRRH